MTTTAAQKKANVIRWLGYQSDTDDIALVTAAITAAIADADNALIIDQSVDRLLAMEIRIYDQALRVPHGPLYMINYVEMHLELGRLTNMLGLPHKSNAVQTWLPTAVGGWLAAILSPAVTPFISLPAINFEDCILKVAPITSDTKPKNVAKGQIWNTITNPQTFEFDGWLWRGRTQGINCGNFNIEIESTIAHSVAGMLATRISGGAYAVGAGVSVSPLGLVIENVRSAIAYDNATGNKLKTSGVTGMVAIGIINNAGTAGFWGKRLLANNNDTFEKPLSQSPPSGVNSQAVETWTDQSPPDFSAPDAIDNRRVNSINPLTAVPGAYLINGAQSRGVGTITVDTGAIAPALGAIFTIPDPVGTIPGTYLVNGLQAIGVSTLVVDSGGGTAPQAGTTMTIGADQTVYTIGSGATTTSWPIVPALVVAAADNANISLQPDATVYQVGAGATTTSWIINPVLQRSVPDNASILIRGATLERDSNRTTITAAGLTTNAGGKTTILNRNTHVQGNLATGDVTYVSPATETFYEYFEPIATFPKIGVCIRTVADAGQGLKVTGTVGGAYALTLAAN
jgi:hypothetical protein